MLKFFQDIFSVNLKDYANIGIDFEINIFIALAAVLISALGFVLGAYRSTLSMTMKQFLRHEAVGEENAKTLKELGLYNSRATRRALSGEGRLSRVVSRVGEKKLTYEEYAALPRKERKRAFATADFDKDRFYIEEANRERAEHVYKTYDTSPAKCALGAILIIALCFAVMIFMPEILTLINNALA